MSSSYYKYFSAILLAFCLVFTINISQAFAQATGVQIVPKGINAAGEYVYTISGTIDENDYSSSLVWWNIVDYDVSVEVGGVQIAIYNIEGGLEEFDLTRGSNNSLAFTKDVVLNSPGIGEVKLISNRWTPNATMNQTSINFDTAQAQMDADAAAGAVPVVPVVPHAGVPIRPAPGSPSPSTPVVSPDCASWTSDADVAKCFAQWGSMASIFLIGVGVVGFGVADALAVVSGFLVGVGAFVAAVVGFVVGLAVGVGVLVGLSVGDGVGCG